MAFVYFYRLQQLIVDYCADSNTYESFETNKCSHYHNETGVVSVPPTEGRHAELGDACPVEHLAGAVRVAAQDQARPEPPQQLQQRGHDRRQAVSAQSPAGPGPGPLQMKPLLLGLLSFSLKPLSFVYTLSK